LQAKVFDELGIEPALDPSNLRVVVKRGTVTLSGTARSHPEKAAAERAAKRLCGVRVVNNHITVGISLRNRCGGASA
jgi:osmotically-inducible protein OsmY